MYSLIKVYRLAMWLIQYLRLKLFGKLFKKFRLTVIVKYQKVANFKMNKEISPEEKSIPDVVQLGNRESTEESDKKGDEILCEKRINHYSALMDKANESAFRRVFSAIIFQMRH